MWKLSLTMLLAVAWGGVLTVRADEPTLGEQLEKLAPHAAGVAQVEVIETKEVDSRPVDGNLMLIIRFRAVQKSGQVLDEISVVKEYGGLRPPGTPLPKPAGPVTPDTFEKGKRYWVAFSPKSDEKYPQGIIQTWPDKTPEVAKVLEAAIRADHYARKPRAEK